MADFNLTVGPTKPDDYTRVSEGYRDNALGELFGNVAEVGQTFVRAKDDFIKRRLGEDAREAYEPLRDAQIAGNAAYGTETVEKVGQTGSLPKEAVNEMNRLGLVRRGVQAGNLSPSYYQSQLDVVVKKLRRSYPGYEDEIDDRMQALSGSIPANKLLAELQQEAAALRTSGNAERKEMEQVYDYAWKAGAIDAEKMPLSSFSSADEIRRVANPKIQAKAAQETRMANMNELSTSGNLTAAEAGRNLQSDLSGITTDVLSDSVSTFGKNFSDLKTKIAKYTADGKPIPNEEMVQLNAMSIQARNSLNDKLDAAGNRKLANGQTLIQLVGTEQFNKYKEAELGRMDTYVGAIRDKQTGTLNFNAAIAQLHKEGYSADLQATDYLGRTAAIKENLGDANLNIWYSKNPDKLDAISTFIQGNASMGVATGALPDLKKVQDEINRNPRLATPEAKRVVMNETMRNLVGSLDNPNTTPQQKVNVISALYGPNSEGFGTTDLEKLSIMSDPAVLSNVKKFSEQQGRPELWNNAMNMVTKTAVLQARNLGAQLRNAAVNNAAYKVSYDTETGMYSVAPRDSSEVNSGSFIADSYKIASDRYMTGKALEQAVGAYNQITGNLRGMLQVNNPSTSKEALQTLTSAINEVSGADVDAKYEGTSLFHVLGEAVSNAADVVADRASRTVRNSARDLGLIDVDNNGKVQLKFTYGKGDKGLIPRETPGSSLKGSQGSDKAGGDAGNDQLRPRGAPTAELTPENQAYATEAIDMLTGIPSFMEAVNSGDPKEIAKQAALAMATILPFPGGKLLKGAEGIAKAGAKAGEVTLLEGARIAKEIADTVPKKPSFTVTKLTPDGKVTVDKISGEAFDAKNKFTKALQERSANVAENLQDIAPDLERIKKLAKDADMPELDMIEGLAGRVDNYNAILKNAGDLSESLARTNDPQLKKTIEANLKMLQDYLETQEEQIFSTISMVDKIKETTKLKPVK